MDLDDDFSYTAFPHINFDDDFFDGKDLLEALAQAESSLPFAASAGDYVVASPDDFAFAPAATKPKPLGQSTVTAQNENNIQDVSNNTLHFRGHQFTPKNKLKTHQEYCCKHRRPSKKTGDSGCKARLKIPLNGDMSRAIFVPHDFNNGISHTEVCKWKNGLIDINADENTENTDPSSKQDPSERHPTKMTNVDFTEEMKATVDEIAVKEFSVQPMEIWKIVSEKMTKRSKLWRGLNQLQVVARVHKARRDVTGGDLLRAIENPDVSTVPNTKQSFLRFTETIPDEDSPGKMDRLIGFGNPLLFGILKSRSVQIFLDATFRCVPKPFYQCLILMAFCEATEVYVPIYYVLMTSKKYMSYWRAFNQIIIDLDMKLNPFSVTFDFEAALMKAVQEQFCVGTQKAILNGCLFHWKQALRRKMMSLFICREQIKKAMQTGVMDLLTTIRKEELESKGIFYVRSLIEDGLSKKDIKKWDSFWAYFNRYWMSPNLVDIWNLTGKEHDVYDLQNRTNNGLERYNRRLNEKFPTPHPSVLVFIATVLRESVWYVEKLENIRMGREKPPTYQKLTLPDSWFNEEYERFVPPPQPTKTQSTRSRS